MQETHEGITRPVFISGRQHSGNTVMAVLLRGLKGWYTQSGESLLVELHLLLDGIQDPIQRADRIFKGIRLEDPDNIDWLNDHLRQMLLDDPEKPSLEAYRDSMDALVSRRGDHQWAQKATSYIFHADELLELIPGSRLIYLLRNPWDLAASKKRRDPKTDRSFGLTYSWIKGVRIAQRLSRSHPDRFYQLRYEDLTGEPEKTVQALCNWLDEPYDSSLLDVPHVNSSENKIHGAGQKGSAKLLDSAAESSTSQGQAPGLNRSKVYRYADQLSAFEIARIDQFIGLFRAGKLIDAYYPELPHQRGRHPVLARVRSAISLPFAPLTYIFAYLTKGKRRPKYLLSRTMRRIRS